MGVVGKLEALLEIREGCGDGGDGFHRFQSVFSVPFVGPTTVGFEVAVRIMNKYFRVLGDEGMSGFVYGLAVDFSFHFNRTVNGT